MSLDLVVEEPADNRRTIGRDARNRSLNATKCAQIFAPTLPCPAQDVAGMRVGLAEHDRAILGDEFRIETSAQVLSLVFASLQET